MTKIAIVSGATGQDGSHMIDYLLENTDHQVIGLARHLSNKNWVNIQHNLQNPRLSIVCVDVTDPISVEAVIRDNKPDYFFHFAANSFVANSWNQPVNHLETNTLSVLYVLEAIRKFSPQTRMYQSGSSEMFGDVKYSPQDEKHPFSPRSIYGVSKVASHYLVKVYRESYNLYCLSGYLFNHESSAGRRGEMFLTKKCSVNVARIYHALKKGKDFEPLKIGNLSAKRDWSAAEDFVRGIYMMMNQECFRCDLQPELYREGKYTKDLIEPLTEYLLSSNETHTVEEFIEKSFKAAGIDIIWTNNDDKRVAHIAGTDKLAVQVDTSFYRPAEVELLWGDSNKVRSELGWKPEISFEDLVKKMTEWDINNYKE
jgi:GDPmannose 4,6-dehydratase